MDDSPKTASLADRVALLRGRLFPELDLERPRKDGRSRKRRSDTSESSLSRKASRVEPLRRRGSQKEALHSQYFTEIQARRDYHATDCVERLGRRLDAQAETESCTGTLIQRFKINDRQVEAVWKRLKGELDVSWSDVALQEGVHLARSGKYSEAMESYNHALKLNRHSCDAYVARGAAYANQGFYQEALRDFEQALDLNPTDKNAIEYRQRIERRKLEREARTQPSTTAPTGQLQYREGVFGRGLPLASKRQPDETEIQTAIEILTQHREEKHSRRHKKRRK